ncbi:MAG: hypothetical protein JHC88_00630 [Niveispirillum sp.]|nr:hypothetical protein [Niveispirillum sp.]
MSSQILTFDKSGLILRSLTGMSMPLPGVDTHGVNAVVAGTLSSDGVADVVVGRDDGTFSWFDGQKDGGKPVEHVLELPLPMPRMFGLERITDLLGIADANGDGRNDVIFTSYLLYSDTPNLGVDPGPDDEMHILPFPYGDDALPPPSGAPAEEPIFTILPYPMPPRPIAVGEPYPGSDLTKIDFSNIKVDLRGVLMTTGNEVYIPGPEQGIAVGEPHPGAGRYAEPAKQIYGVDTDTGNVYVIWDNQDRNKEFVALGNLDARGGVDVLFKDKTTGDLYVKNDLSDAYFVSGITSDGTVSVAAVGNFQGNDSLDEILFYDASSREFSIWVHPPFDIATSYMAGIDYFKTVFKLDFGWDFVGTQDIDGDGIEDIIVAAVGDFAPYRPGSVAPVAYYSSATEELVELGSFDPFTLKAIGNFFDGPSIL